MLRVKDLEASFEYLDAHVTDLYQAIAIIERKKASSKRGKL